MNFKTGRNRKAKRVGQQQTKNMKSKLVAYLLWFFLGWLSIHRFYLGKIGTGLIYLFTGQLFGIGWVVDLFILGGMVDNYNNKKEIKNLKREVKITQAMQ